MVFRRGLPCKPSGSVPFSVLLAPGGTEPVPDRDVRGTGSPPDRRPLDQDRDIRPPTPPPGGPGLGHRPRPRSAIGDRRPPTPLPGGPGLGHRPQPRSAIGDRRPPTPLPGGPGPGSCPRTRSTIGDRPSIAVSGSSRDRGRTVIVRGCAAPRGTDRTPRPRRNFWCGLW